MRTPPYVRSRVNSRIFTKFVNCDFSPDLIYFGSQVIYKEVVIAAPPYRDQITGLLRPSQAKCMPCRLFLFCKIMNEFAAILFRFPDEIEATPFSLPVVKADPEKPDPKIGIVCRLSCRAAC